MRRDRQVEPIRLVFNYPITKLLNYPMTSLAMDAQGDIGLLAAVEGAQRFGIAVRALEFSVDLVVHVGSQRGKPVGSILFGDVGFYGESLGVLEVHNRLRYRLGLAAEDVTCERAQLAARPTRLRFCYHEGAGASHTGGN